MGRVTGESSEATENLCNKFFLKKWTVIQMIKMYGTEVSSNIITKLVQFTSYLHELLQIIFCITPPHTVLQPKCSI